MPKKLIYLLTVLFNIFLALLIIYLIIPEKNYNPDNQPIEWGLTFSHIYAESLGLNWREAYQAMLKDFDVKHLRLVAYWDEIEQVRGQYDYNLIDWQIGLAQEHQVDVILAIGHKVPRWPECFIPDWLDNPETQLSSYKALYFQDIVNHYKDNPTIVAWQIENEPYFPFGDCPSIASDSVRREIQQVKELDPNRPVIATDSGELSLWWQVTWLNPDVLGVSIYRRVWNPVFGYFNHFFSPESYLKKAFLVQPWINKVIVTELQAEPWSPTGNLLAMSLAEQDQAFDLQQFKDNVAFAERTGFSKVLMWGAEWWYWRLEQGDDSFWEYAKTVF